MCSKYLFVILASSFFLATCDCQADSPPASEPDISALANANNAFAFDMFRVALKNAKPNENTVFSPFSISAAMAMGYGGARGETANWFANIMRFDKDQKKFHPAFAEYIRQSRACTKDSNTVLNLANAIWIDQSINVQDSFKQLMKTHHDAAFRTVDFVQTEAARKTINLWVSDSTKKKIPTLLPQGSVNGKTKALLVNALYFQASWGFPFDDTETKDNGFQRGPNDSIMVPMMHKKDLIGDYAKFEDGELVSLSYRDQRFSMVIVLPDESRKLNLTPERWSQWIKALKNSKIDLTMPKFKTSADYSLLEVFSDMPGHAALGAGDMSCISPGLRLDAILHSAVVEVDEAGTIAAAATGLVVGLNAVQGPVSLVVDRPFFFAIYDWRNGNILFLGKVNDPGKR